MITSAESHLIMSKLKQVYLKNNLVQKQKLHKNKARIIKIKGTNVSRQRKGF